MILYIPMVLKEGGGKSDTRVAVDHRLAEQARIDHNIDQPQPPLHCFRIKLSPRHQHTPHPTTPAHTATPNSQFPVVPEHRIAHVNKVRVDLP